MILEWDELNMNLKKFLAAFLTALLVSTPASAQWGLWHPQVTDYDLVVEGTLGDVDSKLILHRGQLFSQESGSITVHRVLHKRSKNEIPGKVTLYSCQSTKLHCTWVFHRALQGKSGVWLLRRSKVKNTYTAYTYKPVINENELQYDQEQAKPEEAIEENIIEESSELEEAPLILGPEVKNITTLISWPNRSALFLWILLGLVPFSIHGKTWRFTKFSKRVGIAAIAASISLLTWTSLFSALIHSRF